MNNYTYSEMQNMQKKAMERVRKMQKNSEEILEKENKGYSYTKNQTDHIKPTYQTKITNMPPNFPEESPYPSFKEYFEKEKKRERQEKIPERNGFSLNNILEEPDRAIILGLIMLLQSENADKWLVMALMYILT